MSDSPGAQTPGVSFACLQYVTCITGSLIWYYKEPSAPQLFGSGVTSRRLSGENGQKQLEKKKATVDKPVII